MNFTMFVRIAPVLFAFAIGFASSTFAQDELPAEGNVPAVKINPELYSKQLGYALGIQIGTDLRTDNVELDLQGLMAGIRDGYGGAKPKLDEATMTSVITHFQQEMTQRARAQMNRASTDNKQVAANFLAKNGSQQGVVKTESGLQYKVIKSGNGRSPTLADTVVAHYTGTLIGGTEFDSSRGGNPATFPVRGVIPGWTEVLQKMKVGDHWHVYIPPELAYGENPPGPPIEPNSLLIFEIELVDVK